MDFSSTISLAHGYTLITDDRLEVLCRVAHQTRSLPGEAVECGVYKGGSARMLAEIVKPTRLHIYDTFEGLPKPDPRYDQHEAGEFATSVAGVVKLMPPNVKVHRGLIPDTLDASIFPVCFAHVDLDLYRSTLSCIQSLYHRMVHGGAFVFDDYTMPDCKGVAQAIGEFFADKPEAVLPLTTGQAVVFRK